MWDAWANARMLGNVPQSPELALVCSVMGGDGFCVASRELGSSTTYWLWQSQQMAGKVAVRVVRGRAGRGSKCCADKGTTKSSVAGVAGGRSATVVRVGRPPARWGCGAKELLGFGT